MNATVIFSQDFETGLTAFESVTGSSYFGRTNVANEGNGTYGVGHHTVNYGNNSQDFYNLSLDLTGFQNTNISFDFSGDIESGFDNFGWLGPGDVGLAYISGTGFTFTNGFINPFGSGDGVWWGVVSGSTVLSLTPYDNSVVSIRFGLATDSSVTYSGIFLDNIVVTGDRVGQVPLPPTIALFALGLAVLDIRRRKD